MKVVTHERNPKDYFSSALRVIRSVLPVNGQSTSQQKLQTFISLVIENLDTVYNAAENSQDEEIEEIKQEEDAIGYLEDF